VAGPFENGNELSGSMKGGKFLDYLSDCQLLKKGSAPWSQSVILYLTLECSSYPILFRLSIPKVTISTNAFPLFPHFLQASYIITLNWYSLFLNIVSNTSFTVTPRYIYIYTHTHIHTHSH
jgi:hypothetical protein